MSEAKAGEANEAKQAAGEAGAALVEDGMRVGLGTGSTTAFALRALGRRLRNGELEDVAGVPTSFAAERRAREEAIPLTALDEAGGLDLALDGADEVDPALNLIKGRGAAHTREKIVVAEATRFAVLLDDSKRVKRLGEQAPVPVEIVPMALAPVTRLLEARGARAAELRSGQGKDGPVVTDQGLWVVDARFASGIPDPEALAEALDRQPGVLDHGLFLGRATDVLVGRENGDAEHHQREEGALP
ncbi:MAG: ribose 5-phosphate isomerase A [Bacteroidetes bacterium QS_7_67_15]|nr:MAG: ribose 5-phosphate isomerase A [Bacteroidetes bacterium QS_7_67_15]